MLDVRRLLILAEVERQGSLTGAAEALMYTTSAVSQQIQRLENEARQPLVDRLPRGVKLTDAGLALAARARSIEIQLSAAQGDLDAISGLNAGSVRLGSFPTVSSSLLPLVLGHFRTENPNVKLNVRSALLQPLLSMLHSREIELALLWDYPWNRIQDEALNSLHLLDDPTVLVVPIDSKIQTDDGIRLADLSRYDWIVRGNSHPVSEVLMQASLKTGFEPNIAYRAQDYQETQAMVAAGIGIALAPRLGLTNLRDDVRLVRLSADDDIPARRILMSRLRDRPITPAVAAMTRVISSVAGSLSVSQLANHQLGSLAQGRG